MKFRFHYLLVSVIILSMILFLIFRADQAQFGKMSPSNRDEAKSYLPQRNENSENHRSRRSRSATVHEKKNLDYYLWKTGDIKTQEIAAVLFNAYQDLEEKDFERFISAFWTRNINTMDPADVIATCEIFSTPEARRYSYLSMFGPLSAKSKPEDMEKARQIVGLVPLDSGVRHLGFRSYYDALSANCSTIEDFTPLLNSVDQLKFQDDKEGARNALAGAIETRIKKDLSFLDEVRAWDGDDDFKSRVLTFHPPNGVLK